MAKACSGCGQPDQTTATHPHKTVTLTKDWCINGVIYKAGTNVTVPSDKQFMF